MATKRRRSSASPKQSLKLSFNPKDRDLAKAVLDHLDEQSRAEEDVGNAPVVLAKTHGWVKDPDFADRLQRGYQALADCLNSTTE